MSILPSPTSPRFHYRLATVQDWGDIATVTQQAYAQYELEIMEDCRASFQRGMQAVLATSHPDMEWWVAETDHGIAGAVLFCHPGATLPALDDSTITLTQPEARLLSVSPQARGLGLGHTLMQICIQRARDIGARRCWYVPCRKWRRPTVCASRWDSPSAPKPAHARAHGAADRL